MDTVNFKIKAIVTPLNILRMGFLVILSIALIRSNLFNLQQIKGFFDFPVVACMVVILFFLMVTINAWRWHLLNSAQAIHFSFSRTLLSMYLGNSFNSILPGSLGDFIRYWYVASKVPEHKNGVILAIVVERISSVFSILIIMGVAIVYYAPFLYKNSIAVPLISMCVGGVIVVCIIIWALLFYQGKRVVKLIPRKMIRVGIALRKATHLYRKSKYTILQVFVLAFLYQLMLLMAILMISTVLQFPTISLFDYLFALTVGQIANLLPLTPGGVGVGETAFANILMVLNPGIIAPYATIFFMFRLLSCLACLPGLAVGVWRFKTFLKVVPQSLGY